MPGPLKIFRVRPGVPYLRIGERCHEVRMQGSWHLSVMSGRHIENAVMGAFVTRISLMCPLHLTSP